MQMFSGLVHHCVLPLRIKLLGLGKDHAKRLVFCQIVFLNSPYPLIGLWRLETPNPIHLTGDFRTG
jgi:hypothetical protein